MASDALMTKARAIDNEVPIFQKTKWLNNAYHRSRINCDHGYDGFSV